MPRRGSIEHEGAAIGRVSAIPNEPEDAPVASKVLDDPKLAALAWKFEALERVDLARKAVGVSRTTANRWLELAGVLKK